MNKIQKQYKIIDKLTKNGWDIISCSFQGRYEIIAEKRWEKISITSEECMCHGGRMWINSEHSNTHYEISHPAYDESLGIVDSSTELDWIIENEMMEYINKLSKCTYKLVKINEYEKNDGVDKESVSFYSDMKSLCHYITDGEDIDDLFLIDEIKHQYPNENIYCITKRIFKKEKYSWEKDRIWFEQTRFNRSSKDNDFKAEKTYEMYVDIFNKPIKE